MQQSQGKTISIYLMDGTSEGRWKASLANWNGVGYRIPRDEVKNCGDIADLNKPGVYFLFGNEIETGRTFIYIGEADAVRTRIMQPHTFEERGDTWTDAVIFVTTDDSLEKGRVKYLENRFYTLAVDAGRYLVRNGNTPKQSPVSAPVRDTLECFISNVRLHYGLPRLRAASCTFVCKGSRCGKGKRPALLLKEEQTCLQCRLPHDGPGFPGSQGKFNHS